MKRIVDGYRYDTTKAHVIATKTDSWTKSRKDLYRTNKGAFFTVYHSSGTTAKGSDEGSLSPMKDAEARKFLEELNDMTALEKYFGDVIVDA